MHRATRRFWNSYNGLDLHARKTADQSFARMKINPRHPSLQLKKVGALWSARVGLHHRALATEDHDGLVWVWIGTHAEYDRLLNKQ